MAHRRRAAFAQLPAQGQVAHHALQGVAQRIAVACRPQHVGLAVARHLARAAGAIKGHARQAQRHGFQEDVGKALHQRTQHEGLPARQLVPRRFRAARQADPRFQAQPGDLRLQRGALGAFAPDPQVPIRIRRRQLREDVDQQIKLLVRDQAAHRQQFTRPLVLTLQHAGRIQQGRRQGIRDDGQALDARHLARERAGGVFRLHGHHVGARVQQAAQLAPHRARGRLGDRIRPLADDERHAQASRGEDGGHIDVGQEGHHHIGFGVADVLAQGHQALERSHCPGRPRAGNIRQPCEFNLVR
ncbi:hypothetical protein G6F57_017850 [Rhizopus arrhizus]|nr:hypothetical protein G6F57_017850 [Rhizopus arrhizus]